MAVGGGLAVIIGGELLLPITPKLFAGVRSQLRLRQMSLRTEQAYLAWIRRYVRYHGVRHLDPTGPEEVVASPRASPTRSGTIQELMGRTEMSTTMTETHVLKGRGRGVRSPADLLRLE
jgi:hypothetical protein